MNATENIGRLVEQCRSQLNSAAIADTLDLLGLHNQVLAPGIKSLDSALILCGLARTGLYMPVYHDDDDINVYENEIALIDSLKSDEVAVLICHGNKRISPWGELLSERSSYLGAAGCLTDGCVRDTNRILALNFPVYSNGTNPSDTKYRGKMMMSDVPGEIGGVRVESGDMVFGDIDGVVIVPQKLIAEVAEKALEKVAAENRVRDEIRQGNSLVDIFARHKIL